MAAIFLTGLLCLSTPSVANDPLNQIYLGDVEEGFLALGFGWRFGNSPYVETDDVLSEFSENSFNLLPFYYYEGRRLFANGASFGAHLLEGDDLSLDAFFSYRFDRLEPEASDFYTGLERRRQSLDGGLRLTWRKAWGELSGHVIADTLGRHDGTEVDFTYRYPWQGKRLRLAPYASVIWQDDALLDYYYGVSAPESRPDLPAYSADADAFVRAGINSSYQWSRNLNLFVNASLTQVPDTAADSPLVDADWQGRLMAGFTYTFGNLQQEPPGRFNRTQADPIGEKVWSWRLHYGYSTEETFHKVHRGYIDASSVADTHLVGVALGRLLIDGPKLDFWGKLSLNRRLEGDFGDDTYDVNAYIMAMGTGFSPWTNRELFRYGFGYGVSYAADIPAVERIKQAEDGENNSHFLNYLEAQIDTPLTNLFGQRAPKNCYIGLTIVHRSGIFGSADVFGNVAGGSDVLAGHLECKR